MAAWMSSLQRIKPPLSLSGEPHRPSASLTSPMLIKEESEQTDPSDVAPLRDVTENKWM